ncbi:hypothetical protein Hanom_Chr10g00957061 [Helianthus anomalus]
MDGVNEPDENSKILTLLDPDEEKQTFGRKLQNWPNLRMKMAFYSIVKKQNIYTWAEIVYMVSDYVQCFGCFVYKLLEPVGIKEASGCDY